MTYLNASGILLIILTPLPYILQGTRIYAFRSAHGISLWATAIGALVSQIQLAYMYILFLMSPTMEEGVPIATPPSMRDRLNAAQLTVQWACSLVLYVTVLFAESTQAQHSTVDNMRLRPGASSIISKLGTIVVLLLHAGLFFVAWTLRNGRPSDQFGALSIAWNVAAFTVNPLTTLLVAIALFLQVRVSWAGQEPDALSERALMAQCIVFLVLAILWPFRLIMPQSMWKVRPIEPVLVTTWYPVVGSVCINNGVMAVGAGFLWWMMVRRDVEER